MGISLGVEAAEGIAEAAEMSIKTAAENEDEIGTEAIEKAISTGVKAGAKAGTEAAGKASVAVGDALKSILAQLIETIQKVQKIVNNLIIFDAILKGAKQILELYNQGLASKLSALITILNNCTNIMMHLTNWLSANANKETQVDDITVTLQGIVSEFLPQLGAAAGILQSLSNTVATKYNATNTPVTAGVVASFETGIKTVLQSLTALATFKEQHQSTVPLLAGMPITTAEIATIQSALP